MTFKLNLIVSVGKVWQIGYRGKLLLAKHPDDLLVFRKLTDGNDIIVGGKTYATLPDLPNRVIHVWDGKSAPEDFLSGIEDVGINTAWLCGGAYTYEAFSPFVNGNLVINHLPSTAVGDTYFPYKAYGL